MKPLVIKARSNGSQLDFKKCLTDRKSLGKAPIRSQTENSPASKKSKADGVALPLNKMEFSKLKSRAISTEKSRTPALNKTNTWHRPAKQHARSLSRESLTTRVHKNTFFPELGKQLPPALNFFSLSYKSPDMLDFGSLTERYEPKKSSLLIRKI